jgi:signal transduction histidine kinase
VDSEPHRLSLDQTKALRALARQVSEYLELRQVAGHERIELELRSVDLSYLLEGRIREMRPIADGRNIVITLASAGSPVILADARRLAQALDYVLFTALKAAPAGGRVAVRVVDRPSPSMEVRHAGGSIVPAWQADLEGRRPADEPLPNAAAVVLRAHEATVATVSQPLGSPDVAFRIQFPTH